MIIVVHIILFLLHELLEIRNSPGGQIPLSFYCNKSCHNVTDFPTDADCWFRRYSIYQSIIHALKEVWKKLSWRIVRLGDVSHSKWRQARQSVNCPTKHPSPISFAIDRHTKFQINCFPRYWLLQSPLFVQTLTASRKKRINITNSGLNLSIVVYHREQPPPARAYTSLFLHISSGKFMCVANFSLVVYVSPVQWWTRPLDTYHPRFTHARSVWMHQYFCIDSSEKFTYSVLHHSLMLGITTKCPIMRSITCKYNYYNYRPHREAGLQGVGTLRIWTEVK